MFSPQKIGPISDNYNSQNSFRQGVKAYKFKFATGTTRFIYTNAIYFSNARLRTHWHFLYT